MPNLDTLNTLIAVVFVLLVLSMIVQSVQEVIKKLLKLKSRQIEESLVDLFENLLGQGEQTPETEQQPGAANLQPIAKIKNSKFLERARMPLRQLITSPSTQASKPAREMFDAVMKEFRDIGRTSASSKRMLDSISKEDLMKVLQRLGANGLLPNFTAQLNKALEKFLSLEAGLQQAEAILPTLDGDAGAKFAKLRDLLAPLFNDLKGLLNGDDSLKPNVLLADALNLRNVKFSEAMDLLGEVQQQVDTALAAATDDARKAELKQAQAGLRDAIQHLSALGEKLDAALAPLRAKVSEVENWFDTVMQSFEERYARGMKTVAFVISLIVAVSLNANIFNIYRDVSTQPAKRQLLLDQAQKRVKDESEKPTATPTPASTSPNQNSGKNTDSQKKIANSEPSTTPGKQEKNLELAHNVVLQAPTGTAKASDSPTATASPIPSSSPMPTASPSPSPSPTATPTPSMKEAFQEIDKNAELFSSFGFKSLSEEMKSISGVWQFLQMLIGWVLMAALLSVGAPFWNDTLQSLFGVKNLLQKKSDIKNVEQQAGAGQPKP